jgi:AcrR family transcriptional regulator
MAATGERRRRLKPEQRRELIVAAAAEEFGRRGHRAARMEDIAQGAGVTKAVLYDHFDSKGALHAEVVTRANRDLLATVAAAAGGAGDPRSRYRAGLLAAFELISERPDVRTLLLGEPGADVRVAKASLSAQRTARAALGALYLNEPGFLAGHPRRRERAVQVAQGAIGTINALAALGIEEEEGLSPERLTDLAMDLMWPGIEAMSSPASAVRLRGDRASQRRRTS